MAKCSQILNLFDQKLFPIDITNLQRQGLYLQEKNYFVYRIFMLLISIFDLIFLIFYSPKFSNGIYLTYWGFILTFIYFLISMLHLYIACKLKQLISKKFWKTMSILFISIITIELMINIIYWFVLFPFAVLSWHKVTSLDIIQAICAHFVPLLLLIVQLMTNCVVITNFSHLIIIIIILILYVIVNAVYTIMIAPVYSILTFDNLISYGFIALTLLILIIGYALIKLYSMKFKQQIIDYYLDKNSNSNPPIVIEMMDTKRNQNDIIIQLGTDTNKS